MKKVGLVTVLYNSESVLNDFFKSLSVQTYNNIILYIIDNNSSDLSLQKSQELVQQYCTFPTKFIINNDNTGVAAANNQGIKAAIEDNVDYILLLNNDIIFSAETIKTLVDFAVLNNEQIIVPMIYHYNSDIIWMAGGGFSKITGLSYHKGTNQKNCNKFNKKSYIQYAPTCFMLIDKKVFLNIGYMDEKYFVYHDDSDFCLRAIRKKYQIMYYPDIKTNIYHKISISTGGDFSLFSIYYMYRNGIYFIRKNYSIIQRLFYLSIFFIKSLIFSRKYNKTQIKKMLYAIKDGFKIKIA